MASESRVYSKIQQSPGAVCANSSWTLLADLENPLNKGILQSEEKAAITCSLETGSTPPSFSWAEGVRGDGDSGQGGKKYTPIKNKFQMVLTEEFVETAAAELRLLSCCVLTDGFFLSQPFGA